METEQPFSPTPNEGILGTLRLSSEMLCFTCSVSSSSMPLASLDPGDREHNPPSPWEHKSYDHWIRLHNSVFCLVSTLPRPHRCGSPSMLHVSRKLIPSTWSIHTNNNVIMLFLHYKVRRHLKTIHWILFCLSVDMAPCISETVPLQYIVCAPCYWSTLRPIYGSWRAAISKW